MTNEETKCDEIDIFEGVAFSKTQDNKIEGQVQDLDYNEQHSGETSENNPEYGLPDVINTQIAPGEN